MTQRVPQWKTFVTLSTWIELRSNVTLPVSFQMLFVCKALITNRTHMCLWLVILTMLSDIVTICSALCLQELWHITAISCYLTCSGTTCTYTCVHVSTIYNQLEMWANAQPDGRPAEYRWRPLLNAAVWLTPTTRVPCSNAAKTKNPLKLAGLPQTNEMISAASRPKFTILWGHLEEILLLNKFFSDCRYVP